MALTSKHIFVNLHVKDLKKTMDFFSAVGFDFNMQFTNEQAACMVIGDNIFAMLLVEEYFKSFTKKEIVDTEKFAELTVAISAESRGQVDEIVNRAVAAGGTLYSKPSDHGFMYQWGFLDVNGHVWEVAYMDPSAIESQA